VVLGYLLLAGSPDADEGFAQLRRLVSPPPLAVFRAEFLRVGEGDLGLSTVESIWMGILDRTPCRSRTAPRERRVVPWVSQFPRASSHLSLSRYLYLDIFFRLFQL
jgi:hypothetical protein